MSAIACRLIGVLTLVKYIRDLHKDGVNARDISKSFNIHEITVGKIVRGQSWKALPPGSVIQLLTSWREVLTIHKAMNYLNT